MNFPIIIYLLILIIYYGYYLCLNWNKGTVLAYRKLCELFSQKPGMIINEPGGGCIWKHTRTDPYIKQFCITDQESGTQMHMQIAIRLFAGYGNININHSAYEKKLQHVLSQSKDIVYDPYTRCLYVYGSVMPSTIETIADMFTRAVKVVEATKAFPQVSNDRANTPRRILNEYYKKYSIL